MGQSSAAAGQCCLGLAPRQTRRTERPGLEGKIYLEARQQGPHSTCTMSDPCNAPDFELHVL